MAKLTVKQLAKLSGVSVRTLHYYDEIGLLTPADVGDNGYRYYDRPEVLRLQQILFYRELGLPLAEVKKTLDDPGFDMAEALKSHREKLSDDIKRYRRLIRTIDETLDELKGDDAMSKQMKNPFQGFAPEQQAQYEEELVDRYGEGAKARIAESKARTGKLSEAEMQAVKDEGHQVNLDLVGLIGEGHEPHVEAVQDVIARHHKWVSNYWTPDAEAYAGLADLYTEHPDFRAFYDKYDERLVEFLSEAMKIYADNKLD
jgi:DNA-binding transcriptional MerR regulator